MCAEILVLVFAETLVCLGNCFSGGLEVCDLWFVRALEDWLSNQRYTSYIRSLSVNNPVVSIRNLSYLVASWYAVAALAFI